MTASLVTQVSALTIQNDALAITRTTLPLDQATTIADSINAGTETEAQYIDGLLSQTADTTIPAVAVEGSMYNAVGSSAKITTLVTQFLPSQIANATRNGLNAEVYASEVLGLAFAFADENGGHGFANDFGPSNAAMPATPAGDAAFAAEAAVTIFGSAATANTVDAILGWINNWEAFYTADGIPGIANATANQIDLAARGAAWGDAVGVALANNLGSLPGQVINFLDDAAQGIADYSASLASEPTPAPFGGGVSALNGQIIFQDNFSTNGPIDSTKWHPHTGITSFLVKTQMRPTLPDASDGVMHLNFDTYNPSDPAHKTFFGSEAISGASAGRLRSALRQSCRRQISMGHVVQTLLNGVLATNGLFGRHGLGIGAIRSLRRHDERQRKVFQFEPALELSDPVVQAASIGGAVEYVRVSTGDNLGQRLAWRLVSDRFGIEALGDVGQTHTVTERVCPVVEAKCVRRPMQVPPRIIR